MVEYFGQLLEPLQQIKSLEGGNTSGCSRNQGLLVIKAKSLNSSVINNIH